MFKTIIAALLVGNFAIAQEAGDLLEPQNDHIKYGYSHESFTKGEQKISEDWLHLRLGDLTGAVELQERDQHRISLNSTLGRLLGLDDKGFTSLFHALQIEARSETKRADWLLLGLELGVAGKLAIYTAAVANDAGSKRLIFGPMFYWGEHDYTSVFLYPGSGFTAKNGAVNVRHHMEIGKFLAEGQVVLKSVEDTLKVGGGLKLGYGILSAKAQYTPNYEGGAWDRMSYELALEKAF